MKNMKKTIVLSLSLVGGMSLMADPNSVKTVGWIPWIGGGVGSLLGGISQAGLGVLSWGAKTVNDTTYTFSDGLCGKDTGLSKFVARGIIGLGVRELIKRALRYQTIIKSVEDNFKEGLQDTIGLRNKNKAYWTNVSVNNSNNSEALKDLEAIKKHFIFKPLEYLGLANTISELMKHDSLKTEYNESKYIDSLNHTSWPSYANNKLTWLFGLDEVKDQVLSLYIRICLCERAVKNKSMSAEILQKLKLS